jgi:hypothetical protein
MEYLISIAAGLLFKVDDEMEDIGFIESPLMKDCIQILSIAMFSLVFLMNTTISLFLCIFLIPICYYLNQVDTPFWKSLVPLPYLAFLLQMYTIQSFSLTAIISNIILFILFSGLCVMEAVVFPEELSLVKIGSRACLSIFFIIIILLFNPPSSITHIICLTLGYFLTSTVVKVFVTNSEDIIPQTEFDKFSGYTIDDILEKEGSGIIRESLEIINLSKKVGTKFFTCIVMIFHNAF